MSQSQQKTQIIQTPVSPMNADSIVVPAAAAISNDISAVAPTSLSAVNAAATDADGDVTMDGAVTDLADYGVTHVLGRNKAFWDMLSAKTDYDICLAVSHAGTSTSNALAHMRDLYEFLETELKQEQIIDREEGIIGTRGVHHNKYAPHEMFRVDLPDSAMQPDQSIDGGEGGFFTFELDVKLMPGIVMLVGSSGSDDGENNQMDKEEMRKSQAQLLTERLQEFRDGHNDAKLRYRKLIIHSLGHRYARFDPENERASIVVTLNASQLSQWLLQKHQQQPQQQQQQQQPTESSRYDAASVLEKDKMIEELKNKVISLEDKLLSQKKKNAAAVEEKQTTTPAAAATAPTSKKQKQQQQKPQADPSSSSSSTPDTSSSTAMSANTNDSAQTQQSTAAVAATASSSQTPRNEDLRAIYNAMQAFVNLHLMSLVSFDIKTQQAKFDELRKDLLSKANLFTQYIKNVNKAATESGVTQEQIEQAFPETMRHGRISTACIKYALHVLNEWGRVSREETTAPDNAGIKFSADQFNAARTAGGDLVAAGVELRQNMRAKKKSLDNIDITGKDAAIIRVIPLEKHAGETIELLVFEVVRYLTRGFTEIAEAQKQLQECKSQKDIEGIKYRAMAEAFTKLDLDLSIWKLPFNIMNKRIIGKLEATRLEQEKKKAEQQRQKAQTQMTSQSIPSKKRKHAAAATDEESSEEPAASSADAASSEEKPKKKQKKSAASSKAAAASSDE